MNVERLKELRKVMQWVERRKRRLNMHSWFDQKTRGRIEQVGYESAGKECGTVGCAAGWYKLRADADCSLHLESLAQHFGIILGESIKLFAPQYYPALAKPRHVIAKIDRLLAGESL